MASPSNEETAALIAAIGAVVAAIIGGLVAFFSLIVSKEQSVSGFRQAWIDALREDVATLVAKVIGAHGTAITQAHASQPLWDRIKVDFTGINEVIVRIRLRLNPNEARKNEGEATKGVLNALDEIEQMFGSDTINSEKLERLTESLVTNARIILKENWDRVRSGEPVYWLTKWITLCVSVFLLIGSVAYILLKMI